MIRLQTESKPPPQPFIGVVYRGLCLFRGGNPQNPNMLETLNRQRVFGSIDDLVGIKIR